MTREEAIEILRGAIKKPNTKDGYLGQAIDLAIKALEQEPTTKNDLGVDCISREQAKAAIRDKFKDLPSRVEINTILNELPSVTPQLSSELEKNSKKLEKDFGESDCISRAQAQTEIEMNASRYTIAKERGGMGQVEWSDQLIKVSDAVDIIRALPSVTPQEPQTFKWCTDCKEYDQEKHCCHRWSKVIRDTVEEMKQEQESRWIPVSEYLPVTNDEVLVTYIVNGNAKKRYVETANCFDGEWSSVNDEYRIPNTKIEVIAWCEMPKPYKAEFEPQE